MAALKATYRPLQLLKIPESPSTIADHVCSVMRDINLQQNMLVEVKNENPTQKVGGEGVPVDLSIKKFTDSNLWLRRALFKKYS